MTRDYHPLGRKPDQRRMLLRNLVTSLILYEVIQTTKTRAKVLQPLLDRLITKARTQSPQNAIRSLNRILLHQNASRKTMEVLVPRYRNRPSGYSRIRPLGRRVGDGAEMVELRLVSSP